jgi:PAS domain S-box-containing protein
LAKNIAPRPSHDPGRSARSNLDRDDDQQLRVYLRGDLEIPPDGGTRVDSGWFNSSHWNRCRPLNASRGPLKERQRAARPWVNLIHSWRGAVRLAVAIGVSYFLASRLGMFFRAEPEGLAVFSPAAGIATGALIAFGAAARLPAASAVVCATIACSLIDCSLMMGRSPWLAIPLSLANAGQPLITAWLIDRWFGDDFKLEDVRRVVGFLVASTIGAAVAGAAAAVAINLFEPATLPFNVWRLWFASCLLGIITIAPLFIGLVHAVRQGLPRRELIEGAIALMTLAALSAFLVLLPRGAWATALPVAVAFPVLLWVAVRCRPLFSAAATFVVTLTVVLLTTFNMGHFADASIPAADRMLAAQTIVLAGALLTLVLTALFSERRRSEAELRQSKERLQLALDGAELGAFSADLATGRLECDSRAAQIHGYMKAPMTIKESRRFVHQDDLLRIEADLAQALQAGRAWNVEYRVVPPPNHPHAGETRWIAVESSIVRGPRGSAVGLLGVTRDITPHKRAEQALAERNAQLALAGPAALVGSYAYDVDAGKLQISEGYAAIHGLPEGTNETTIREWLARVHSEDVAHVKSFRDQMFAEKRRLGKLEYRILRSDGEVRWIERRNSVSYSVDGRPERVVGVSIDVSERKRAEQYQRTLNAELDHRVKNILATVGAIIAQTREASASQADFVAGLNHRIESLARTHELLSETHWHDVPLVEIIRRELAPYRARNTDIGGPNLTLKAEAAQGVAMVLHELTTNAAKYGALSSGNGRVTVQWRWLQNGLLDRLVIDWQEIDGPPVRGTNQSSYGTNIIRELIPFELGGSVELSFATEGAKCRIEIPGEWANRTADTANVLKSPGIPSLSTNRH